MPRNEVTNITYYNNVPNFIPQYRPCKMIKETRKYRNLREMTTLSPPCVTEMKCIVGLHCYLITSPLNKCKLGKIRTSNMQPTRLIHGNKLTGYLANHDPKLIIRITDTARMITVTYKFITTIILSSR